jgi:hypothetical protein
MACSSLLPIISRYLSFLFFGLLAFTCIVQSAPPPAGQSVIPTAIDYNTTSERPSLVSRDDDEPTIVSQRWPGVWTGKVSCQNVLPNGLASFARGIAVVAYGAMLKDGGPKANLVTTFCIPGQYCWIATIPNRNPEGKEYVAEQMRSVPQWLEAYGPQYEDSQYHSEDLAIALAAGDGVRYPYSVEINGKPVNATMRVYGLYKVINNSNPAVDQIGAVGDRWPCTFAGRDINLRTQTCSQVLTKLGISFLYKP